MFLHKNILLGLALSLSLAACVAPAALPTTTPRPTFDFSSPTPFMTATVPPRPSVPVGPSPTPVPFAQSVLVATWDAATQLYSLRALDPHTGQTLPGYAPLPLGKQYWVRLSPDKKTLAYIGYPNTDTGRGGRLHWVDLQTWTDLATDVVVDYWPTALAYRPDNKAFAFSYTLAEQHWLVEVARDALTGQSTPASFKITHLAYTPDSTALMLYGQALPTGQAYNPTTQVAFHQSGSLSQLWIEPLPSVWDGDYLVSAGSSPTDGLITWQPAVVFAPAQPVLYVVLADATELQVIDFAQHTIAIHNLRAPQGFWNVAAAEAAEHTTTRKQAVIAPDGLWLYVLGEEQLQTTAGSLHKSLGLQVIDLTQYHEIATLDVAGDEVRWGATYRYLLVNTFDHTTDRQAELVNVETLQSVQQFNQLQLTSGFSQDGQPWLLGLHPLQTLGRYQLLDWDQLQTIAHWPTRNYVEFIDQP